jgi:hypothetical protein
MSLRPIVRFSRKLTVASLVLTIFLMWSPPAKLQTREFVRITLTIKVSDESGQPVANAKISIPRQGVNADNQPLMDISAGTNAKGEYTKLLTDFQLTGTPHKIIVTAGDRKVEEPLPDQQLREAKSTGNGVLVVPVSLKKQRQGGQEQKLTISGTVTDQFGRPISAAVISLSARSSAPGGPATEATTKSGSDGRFELPDVEFEPEDARRNLKVSATRFQDFEITLTNEELGTSSNNILHLNPIRLVAQISVFQQIKNFLDWVFWTVGLLTVLMLGTYLVYRTHRWRTHKSNQSPPPRTPSPTGELVLKIYEDLQEIKNSMLTEAKLGPALTQSLNARFGEQGEQKSNNQQQNDKSTSKGDSTTLERDPVSARDDAESIVPQVELGRDPQRIAQEAYQNLLNKNPVDPEPVYLDVEPPRSAAGKLEDKTVYLTQVSHSNAALVLFTANNSAGWLFPNPKLVFSTAAVGAVFLDLTETEYQAKKYELEPRQAVRVDDARWKIASS